MDIGFLGKGIMVLKKPIDDEFPVRFFANIEKVTDAGVLITYEDDDEEKHTYFVPFTNIRGIEKDDSPEETPVEQTAAPTYPQQTGGF